MTRDAAADLFIGELIDIGHRLWLRSYIAANDGNLSVRLDENRVLTTVAGAIKGFLGRDDFMVVDFDGRAVDVSLDGERTPSSELKMHLEIYDARPETRAVVHAHPPAATGFAAARCSFPADVLPETVVLLGDVPLVPYATPSTREVPEALRPHVGSGYAALLANHGAVTWGDGPYDAYHHMERLEQAASILLAAERLGGAVRLSPEEIDRLRRATGAT